MNLSERPERRKKSLAAMDDSDDDLDFMNKKPATKTGALPTLPAAGKAKAKPAPVKKADPVKTEERPASIAKKEPL